MKRQRKPPAPTLAAGPIRAAGQGSFILVPGDAFRPPPVPKPKPAHKAKRPGGVA